jgi:hypothetical protein
LEPHRQRILSEDRVDHGLEWPWRERAQPHFGQGERSQGRPAGSVGTHQTEGPAEGRRARWMWRPTAYAERPHRAGLHRIGRRGCARCAADSAAAHARIELSEGDGFQLSDRAARDLINPDATRTIGCGSSHGEIVERFFESRCHRVRGGVNALAKVTVGRRSWLAARMGLQPLMRRDGRAVDGGGLENRWTGNGPGGSNPSPSANLSELRRTPDSPSSGSLAQAPG